MGIDLESIAVGHAWLPPQVRIPMSSVGVREYLLPFAKRFAVSSIKKRYKYFPDVDSYLSSRDTTNHKNKLEERDITAWTKKVKSWSKKP